MENPSHRVRGYPSFAAFMAGTPGLPMLRSFKELAMLCLLYQHAELVRHERELHAYQKADSRSEQETRRAFSRDWYWLNKSAVEGSDDQLKTAELVKLKLKEYCTLSKFVGSPRGP